MCVAIRIIRYQQHMTSVTKLLRSEMKSMKRKLDTQAEHDSNERNKIMRGVDRSSNAVETDINNNNFPDELPTEAANLANFDAATFVFDRDLALPRQLKLYWKGSLNQRTPPLHLIDRTTLAASERNMYVDTFRECLMWCLIVVLIECSVCFVVVVVVVVCGMYRYGHII